MSGSQSKRNHRREAQTRAEAPKNFMHALLRSASGEHSPSLQDEPVGQRWGKVESALLGRRRSHSPTAPRCLRAARHGRTARDLRRTDRVSGWHRSKRTYKRKRNGERGSVSSWTAAKSQKRGESRVTAQAATRVGRGRRPAKAVGKR